MKNTLSTSTDKDITLFIKEYIINKNLCIHTLSEILKPNFDKEDLYKILKGEYIFTVEKFIYIISMLKIHIEHFDVLYNTTNEPTIVN